MKLRTVLSVGVHSDKDLEKPVLIRLGLWDPRIVQAIAHTSRDGHLMLVLDRSSLLASPDQGPYGRGYVMTPGPTDDEVLKMMRDNQAAGKGILG